MTQPFSCFHSEVLKQPTALRLAITEAYRRDEALSVQMLLNKIVPFDDEPIQALAKSLIEKIRDQHYQASWVDALMHEFSLSSDEGVALLCLAEALLRIPDHQTKDRFIANIISKGDWHKHLGESSSLFVNVATWSLLITGKLVLANGKQGLISALTKLIAKGGEPLIRKGINLAMRILGNQFITGQSIEKAIQNSQHNERQGYRYSYDMLGEAALTRKDAAVYFSAYEKAIHAIGKASSGRGIKNGPGISVKLSALHPRYSRAQRGRVMSELLPDLKKLLLLAKHYNIGFNIDAEEADRLELSLDLITALVVDPDLAGFDGLGIAVQAYQKRCPFVLDFLVDLARKNNRKLMIRLVKGAYWDTEIKRAQVDGMPDYPVYTRKTYTDVCYLFCAQQLLSATDVIYPQFATHNALTLATIYTLAEQQKITDYEFQCLHGMGENLYNHVVGKDKLNRFCRIYAPVGSHDTLLAYLVRRLLENGANSSFVNQIVNHAVSVDSLIENPITIAKKLGGIPHSGIRLPPLLFGQERKNSTGFDFSDENNLRFLSNEISKFSLYQWTARPLIHGITEVTTRHDIINPAVHTDIVGHVSETSIQDMEIALQTAFNYADEWQKTTAIERASFLNKAADLIEVEQVELIALAVREAGKSFPNAIAEVREAVDFLRYYAAQISSNETHALGPVACISPWNFPLSIFIGEVSAALAAGNVVLAKPAEQTPLIAYRAIQLLHKAGIPTTALQFLPGQGETIGAKLVADSRIQGVLFTGSTEVAYLINQTLVKRTVIENSEIPFIAETGGQNALIVDSSALTEQVVQDVLSSAFDSAGQRCSALRVLCLQHDIFDKTMEMIYGAMQELRIGNPDRLSVDIGPVIDVEAKNKLLAHIDLQRAQALSFYQLTLPKQCNEGYFVAPTVIEIASLSELKNELFGPVLHVIKYQRNELPQLIEQINQTGFGLTLGIHSRIDETIQYIIHHTHVGNIYVNRNMIGAVVGAQPFGGEGKSGTGPKAGGPYYLKRLQKYSCPQLNNCNSNKHFSSELFTTLFTWLKKHNYSKLIVLAEQYSTSSLLNTKLNLPGPTGEQNTLSFEPRGQIYCAAINTTVLLNQLAAVLVTENIPAMSKETTTLLPSDFPDSIKKIIQIAPIELAYFQIALLETSLLPSLSLVIASKSDCIAAVIKTNENEPVPLWRLLAEHALCINTTAAGGNAILMTLIDEY